MRDLHATRGRIVELRRHTNVHLYWRGRRGPAERYELWLRDIDGCECQFIVNSRIMPARRGHEVAVIANTDTVHGIVNWSTGMSVNYLRADPPSLWRSRDLWTPLMLLTVLASRLGDIGCLLFPPVVLLYFLIVVTGRYVLRVRHATVIQRVLFEMRSQRDVERHVHHGNRRIAKH